MFFAGGTVTVTAASGYTFTGLNLPPTVPEEMVEEWQTARVTGSADNWVISGSVLATAAADATQITVPTTVGGQTYSVRLHLNYPTYTDAQGNVIDVDDEFSDWSNDVYTA